MTSLNFLLPLIEESHLVERIDHFAVVVDVVFAASGVGFFVVGTASFGRRSFLLLLLSASLFLHLERDAEGHLGTELKLVRNWLHGRHEVDAGGS